ncbi:hypothetical protein A2U01_0115043, partial [Trifolium medium]|nr:hypothetical protein [Trifolium medium]
VTGDDGDSSVRQILLHPLRERYSVFLKVLCCGSWV